MKTLPRAKQGTRDLSGQVVLLTGAANGIGAETARQLVARGARVALLDRDEPSLATMVSQLGDQVAGFPADVSDADSIESAIRAAADHFGGLDAVVANAGITGRALTVEDIDPVEFERVIQINLFGVYRTVTAALPYLKASSGYIMMASSIMSVVPSPTVASYAASKAGVEAFGRALRIELADQGVDVGIAYFGLIETNMVSATSAGGVGDIVAALPKWLAKKAPVSTAGSVVVSGIEHRSRRIYAPRYVPLLLDLRVLVAKADALTGRNRAMKEVVASARRRALAETRQ